MLGQIDSLNPKLKQRKSSGDKSKQLENLILLGVDAEALYPSLKKKITQEVVAEELMKSPQTFQYLDEYEMGRYLYLTMTPEEHESRGITHLIQTKDDQKWKEEQNHH